MATQRYFNTLGNFLVKISDAILKDTELCKLLKYSDNRDSSKCPDFDTSELLNTKIRLVPLLPEVEDQDGAFIVIFLSRFDVDLHNSEFQINAIRFDILVPNKDWLNVNETLKPFAIMAKLDELLNGKRVGGIGKLVKTSGQLITLTDNLSGYSMLYEISEFN